MIHASSRACAILFGRAVRWFAPPLAATGSDAAREQRGAGQIIPGLLDSDAIWLDD